MPSICKKCYIYEAQESEAQWNEVCLCILQPKISVSFSSPPTLSEWTCLTFHRVNRSHQIDSLNLMPPYLQIYLHLFIFSSLLFLLHWPSQRQILPFLFLIQKHSASQVFYACRAFWVPLFFYSFTNSQLKFLKGWVVYRHYTNLCPLLTLSFTSQHILI